MKSVLTALGNPTLNQELRKYNKYDVVSEDLFYQEAVLDFLKENELDVIVLSALLQGQYNMLDFVKEVKKKQITARVILIVETISEEEKNILISKGIFDILHDNEIEIIDVIEAIDREEPINLKLQLEREIKNKEKELFFQKEESEQEKSYFSKKEPILITQIQKQEIIAVFGTNGSGKSTIISGLAKNFAKKTKSKILLIDLDTLSGNLDELMNVSKIPENIDILMDEDKKCGINYVADLVLKNRFDSNVLDEVIISCGELDFVSGNTSLHYCQNVLNIQCYEKLLECAKEKYDFILIDCSSNIFLDSTKWALQNSSKILFVTENSNIALKKSIQLLDVTLNLWKIWKDKIKIVLNKTNINGLSEDVFVNVCGLQVIANIKQDKENLFESYEKILETLKYIPKKNFLDVFEYEKNKLFTKIKEKTILNKLTKESISENSILTEVQKVSL